MIERGGGLEVDDPGLDAQLGAVRGLRLDEVSAAPALGRARHVDVEDVGHFAAVGCHQPQIGEPGLTALGHFRRNRHRHEAAVRGHALGRDHRSPVVPRRPRAVRVGRRLRRDDHAGGDDGDDDGNGRSRRHVFVLPTKRGEQRHQISACPPENDSTR